MNLKNKKWKSFFLSGKDGLFELTSTSSGADKDKIDISCGIIPYVSRSKINNGIALFISKKQNFWKTDFGNSITIGLDTQTVNYQPYEFYTGQNIQVLKSSKFNEILAQFINTATSIQISKFSWGGNGATLGRLHRTKIMLPVNFNNEPDWKFMEQYINHITQNKIDNYINYCNFCLSNILYKNIPNLNENKWMPFKINSLFNKFITGKSKGLTHYTKTTQQGIQYISATNKINGISCFIENEKWCENHMLPGNCIGFIKNGNGSAGYAIYKASKFVSTSDVIYGYANWLNKYTGLFFVTAQDMIFDKYSHSYKRNKKHLLSDKIMLPVNLHNKPDYKYMEQYTKNIMINKYQSYLNYIKQKKDMG